ncbi:class I SAM-dependent methyltransferase [Amycolatopsis granulosa]|uniref:class I SAM-dependent methyltransferase n=1 Tax=Amycolatopsis granulosa TaxID=185684 RepID=UPI001421720F|nr:class I SAM-dependent methyltransferase [Amycolatopsis granulosa]NIH86862.1 SAM-dependent methyltransferase [Amycolatopsis granulosa]
MADAVRRWARQLADWAIPEHILAAAPESPWVVPRTVFARRADRQIAEPGTPTHQAVLDALPGTVLDVGAGAGAASLPCARAITHVTAVDTSAALLAEFRRRAEALSLSHTEVEGRWPDVAVGPADVVVCAHVLYNVPDLAPFVAALTAHARRKVVVELAHAHPLTSLNPLWRHFHGIDRPSGPTAADAIAALRELGVEPEVVRWRKAPKPEYERFDELVDVTRRRLCLPAGRADEVAEVLRGLGVDEGMPPDLGSSGREVVTLSWPGRRPG